ncbi:MAG: 2-oxo acid dehydrogenase subunit E2 [Bryobacteraceae bacterium]
MNASIEGTNIVYHNEINLGIAVALDGGSGLIVPVIAMPTRRMSWACSALLSTWPHGALAAVKAG